MKPGEDPPPPATSQPQTQPEVIVRPTHQELKEVKDEIVAKLKLKRVLSEWRKQLDGRITEHMQEAFEQRAVAGEALIDAETAQREAEEELPKAEEKVQEAEEKLKEAEEKLKEAEAELAKDKDNVELKQRVEAGKKDVAAGKKDVAAGKKAVEAGKKAVEAGKKDVETKEQASKDTDKAVDARLAQFDFEAAVKDVAKGRPVKFAEVAEPKFAEGLKTLPDGLGEWSGSYAAGTVTRSGEVHSSVQDIKDGLFLFQVTKFDERPYKEWKEIKEDLEVDYYTYFAEKEGKDKKEKFEKALERLAKEKGKDEIAKIEKEQAEALDKKVTGWRDGLQKRLDFDQAQLKQLSPGTFAHQEFTKKKNAVEKELAGEADYRESEAKKLKEETEEKTKEITKKCHKDVLAAAAKEAGFDLIPLGPLSKRLRQTPRFEYNHDKLVTKIWGAPSLGESGPLGLEEGEATDLEEDTTEKLIYLAVCTKVQKSPAKKITRREWMTYKRGLTLHALRLQIPENPDVLMPLFRNQQWSQNNRELNDLLFRAITGDKAKATQLVNHEKFLPVLKSMRGGEFLGYQRQLAANQSFSMDALKKGYKYRLPEQRDQPAGEPKTEVPTGGGKPGKPASEPTSRKQDSNKTDGKKTDGKKTDGNKTDGNKTDSNKTGGKRNEGK